jgi:hypothetical protein
MGENAINDAVESAINVATILNVCTITNMNGCDLLCFPGDDLDAKVDALRHAWALNASSVG